MILSENELMLSFGPFTVDVLRRTVSKNGVPLRLTLKCVELLIAFVRNPGKPLTKQELLESAWPDPQASDATLAQHIFLLRRALRPDGSVWIRTIPNVGYCFTAEVTAAPNLDDERARALNAYLAGARTFRDIGTERALRSAIDLCSRAISIDDANAEGYAMRASCWRLLAQSMHAEPVPCLQSAKADAEAAIARGSAVRDARIEAAACAALLDRDAERAQQHLDEVPSAHRADAALTRARVRLALMGGRHDDALRFARLAGGTLHATVVYMSGDYAQALTLLEAIAESDLHARLLRGSCRLLTGDPAAAAADFRYIYYAEREDAAEGVHRVRQQAYALYILALAKMGDVQSARSRAAALNRLANTRYVSPMARAVTHHALGESETAIAFIEDAMRRRDPWSAYVFVDPLLADLREHPQFSNIAHRAA